MVAVAGGGGRWWWQVVVAGGGRWWQVVAIVSDKHLTIGKKVLIINYMDTFLKLP